MADLIDRAALLEDIEKTVIYTARDGAPFSEMCGGNKVANRIIAAPAVDAVEVVRCKDCAKCEPIQSGISGLWSYDCNFHDMEVNADDYCSCGERREDDG